MRVVLTSLAGIAASSALYGFSQLADGLVAATLYILALLVAPFVIGVAVATAINGRREASPPRPSRGRAPRLGSEAHPCGGCGSPMMAMNSAWVCSACDLAPAR